MRACSVGTHIEPSKLPFRWSDSILHPAFCSRACSAKRDHNAPHIGIHSPPSPLSSSVSPISPSCSAATRRCCRTSAPISTSRGLSSPSSTAPTGRCLTSIAVPSPSPLLPLTPPPQARSLARPPRAPPHPQRRLRHLPSLPHHPAQPVPRSRLPHRPQLLLPLLPFSGARSPLRPSQQ